MEYFYRKHYWFYAEGFRRFSESYIGDKKWREWAQRRVERYAHWFSSSPRVLDVGCGAGLFLHCVKARDASATVSGIEPDHAMSAYCYQNLKIPVYTGFFDTFESSEKFDIIAAFHVIEHLFDLQGFFRFLHSHLVPAGIVIIETPNIDGSWRGIGMFHLSHLYAYSPRTITNLFRANGFAVLQSGALETNPDSSNLFLIAQKVKGEANVEVLPRDAQESARIRAKCGEIRALRPVRIVRNWAKIARFLLRA